MKKLPIALLPIPEKLMKETLVSLAVLPTLALLFATRSAAATMVTLGQWSEEVLRGDRLPIRDVIEERHKPIQ